MKLQLWHGSGHLFEHFIPIDHFGNGESGHEAGWGVYTDVSPRGAGYYSEYVSGKLRTSGSYLYCVQNAQQTKKTITASLGKQLLKTV